jgi:uncharacterized protein (UPF0335 family)
MISKDHLKQYIERLERLHEDKSAVMEDIKEVMAEAKNNGFDVKTIRQILKLRKISRDDLAEQEALLELYRDAVGV